MILTTEQKTFIVTHLACYYGQKEVCDLIKENWGGETIPNQQVAYYDAAVNPQLPKVWRELFEQTRAKFRSTVDEIPIANQSVRLKKLQASFDRIERAGRNGRINEAMLHSILEQAAKEVGGMFTNRRELTGKGGERLMPTAEEIARDVYQSLMKEEGFTPEQAIEFVKDRYKVSADVIVAAEGNN